MDNNLPNWKQEFDSFYERVTQHFSQLLTDHPSELFNFFAIGITTDPYGIFALNADTLTNSLNQAQAQEKKLIERREKLLHFPNSWTNTYFLMEQESLKPYTKHTGDFAYSNFSQIEIELWKAFDNKKLPDSKISQDDYLLAQAKLLVWAVLERLIEKGLFYSSLASPFYLGYQIYDEDNDTDIVVLRIINWPSV